MGTAADIRAIDGRGALPASAGYAEQALFERSPFNLWLTGALLYLLLAATYVAATLVDHIDLESSGAKQAAILALLLCDILMIQRYSRLRDAEDAAVIPRALKPGTAWTPYGNSLTRLRAFGVVGGVVGVALLLAFIPRSAPGANPRLAQLMWFAVVSGLLGAMLFRGVELTRSGSRYTRKVIDESLEIDLLRIDRLYPWGRSAARTALVWFTVSATISLFFVSNGGFSLYVAAMLIGSAVMGVWVFLGTLTLVHRRIRAAKADELESLRSEIAAAKAALDRSAAAGARLQGLLAYEARIASAPEWPFDQTILIRVGASALILTVPWFGQALATAVVEKLGR